MEIKNKKIMFIALGLTLIFCCLIIAIAASVGVFFYTENNNDKEKAESFLEGNEDLFEFSTELGDFNESISTPSDIDQERIVDAETLFDSNGVYGIVDQDIYEFVISLDQQEISDLQNKIDSIIKNLENFEAPDDVKISELEDKLKNLKDKLNYYKEIGLLGDSLEREFTTIQEDINSNTLSMDDDMTDKDIEEFGKNIEQIFVEASDKVKEINVTDPRLVELRDNLVTDIKVWGKIMAEMVKEFYSNYLSDGNFNETEEIYENILKKYDLSIDDYDLERIIKDEDVKSLKDELDATEKEINEIKSKLEEY